MSLLILSVLKNQFFLVKDAAAEFLPIQSWFPNAKHQLPLPPTVEALKSVTDKNF